MTADNDPIQIGREWHFPDGTILPVVSGASDTGDGELFDAGDVEPDPGLFDFEQPNASTADLSSPFLKNVAEADRPVVAKYLKQIQGGVTKKFQSIHDEYAPFKGMDPEQVAIAMQFFELANESPDRVVEALLEAVPELSQRYKPASSNGNAPPVGESDFDNPWRDDGVPDAFAKEHMELRQIVGALAEQFLGAQNESQEAAEDAELDQVIEELHGEYGDFNEELVLLKIANGIDPDEAVQAWQSEMQQYVDNRRSPRIPPPVAGGNGSVASGGVDPSKMSGKETRDYVARMLEMARDNS